MSKGTDATDRWLTHDDQNHMIDAIIDETKRRARLASADPRNPQPGQVWNKKLERYVVKSASDKLVRTTCCMPHHDDDPFSLVWTSKDWRRWACGRWPWSRNAVCVEWREDK